MEKAVSERLPCCSQALATLIINKLRAGAKLCAVKAPGFGENRKNNLEDLAVLTGGQVCALIAVLGPETERSSQLRLRAVSGARLHIVLPQPLTLPSGSMFLLHQAITVHCLRRRGQDDRLWLQSPATRPRPLDVRLTSTRPAPDWGSSNASSCSTTMRISVQVISEELGMKLENVDLSQLGRAKKVSVSKVRGTLPWCCALAQALLTVDASLAEYGCHATLCQQDPVSPEKLRLVGWSIFIIRANARRQCVTAALRMQACAACGVRL